MALPSTAPSSFPGCPEPGRAFGKLGTIPRFPGGLETWVSLQRPGPHRAMWWERHLLSPWPAVALGGRGRQQLEAPDCTTSYHVEILISRVLTTDTQLPGGPNNPQSHAPELRARRHRQGTSSPAGSGSLSVCATLTRTHDEPCCANERSQKHKTTDSFM